MFEVGFAELVVIGLVALLVIGPEKLPRVARETALWLRKAREMVHSVKREVDQELRLDELRQSGGDVERPIREFRDSLNQFRRDLKGNLIPSEPGAKPNSDSESASKSQAETLNDQP